MSLSSLWLFVKVNPRYLIESVYGIRAALMFNSGNCSLKSLGVKATQNDFNALKFTCTYDIYSVILVVQLRMAP